MVSDHKQYQMQVLGMILLVLGKNQNIIEIHHDEIICVRVEDEVHHARESWWSVDEDKIHDSVFI